MIVRKHVAHNVFNSKCLIFQCKVQEFSTLGMQKMNLLIITGRGKHSQKGAVLFPKVEHYLAQREYQ